MEFSSKISKILEFSGKSVASLSRDLAVNPGYIQDLKSGKSKNPKTEFLSLLVEKLGVSPRWLLTGEGPMFQAEEKPNTPLPAEDDGFRDAFPDVYSVYKEVQRLKTGQPGAAPPIPEIEELDEESREAVAEFARFRLARQRERESRSPPKPAPALPPAAASSKADEVHEPAPEYGRPKMQIPHIIGAAAGEPREVFVDDMYELSRDKVDGPAKDYVAVTISGTSMTEADINDGDVVIVRRDRDLIDGRIFLVRYEDEYVLKRYRRNADGTERLDYEDGSGRSVVVKPGDWQVIGAFCFVAEKAGRAPA